MRLLGSLHMINKEVAKKYSKLKREWEEAQGVMSFQAIQLPEFKQMVELGPEIIPLIIADIFEEQSWIVLALGLITQERPSQKVIPGNLPSYTAAWILWADEKGYI